MTRLTPILAAAACAICIATSAEAGQSPYQVHVERQRGELLVIDHTPPARIVGVVRRTKIVRKHPARVRKAYRRSVVARYRDSALAGGCYDGGYVSGADARGNLYTLHRDICEGIAPTDRPYRFNRW